MKITSIIDSYLNGSLNPNFETAGNNDTVDKNDSDKVIVDSIFINRLHENSSFNNKIIITLVILLLIIFIFIGYLIIHFISLKDITTVLSLLGGEGVSFLVIIRYIHRLYKDKIFTDSMLYILPKLNSEAEKVKYIESLRDFLKS